MARRRLDGAWEVPQSALDTDQQDRRRGRVRMLNGSLEGGMESWTLPTEQWELVRDVILDVLDDGDPVLGVLLKSVVTTVQARLESHPAFPGGRLTNFTRYIKGRPRRARRLGGRAEVLAPTHPTRSSVAAGLLPAWLASGVVLLIARPERNLLSESFRLMPELLRLVARLARDRALPRGVRVQFALLLAYLAFPLDLIPDVIPVVGHADDVIAVLRALRSVIRTVGEAPIRQHWPGNPAGGDALLRLARPGQKARWSA